MKEIILYWILEASAPSGASNLNIIRIDSYESNRECFVNNINLQKQLIKKPFSLNEEMFNSYATKLIASKCIEKIKVKEVK